MSTLIENDPPIAASPTAAPDEARLLEEFRKTRKPGQVTKSFLDGVRETLKVRHFASASGSEIVRELTAAVDHVVRALFVYAAAEHDRRFSKLNQRLAVLARGGYGRGELNPYSDIDLLFLHDWKPGPYLEIIAEIILHALWDAGLIVGHAVRNIRECVRMADGDLKEKTAILDSRFLAGDSKLWAELENALLSDVLNRNQAKFFKAKLEESRKRHTAYGDSVYLLEPNLKEGEGGLRDLHTALWVAKVKYKVNSLEELVHKAIITQSEMDEVARARDFLWRVRNSLHFLSGRHFDQLTFEYQEELAPRLGFSASQGQSASSALMRAYYQQATIIKMFAEGLIARITEEPDGVLRRFGFGRQIRPGVLIQRKLLAVADPDLFKRDPLNLVTIFADCQAHDVRMSGATYQLVRDHLNLIDEAARQDPRYGAALMRILDAPHRVAETLEAMHRAGVLGAIIPEFGNLYARVLHDLYHIYTVDRHSLVAVRELERLRSGEFKAAVPLLTEVAREADTLPLVFLALVLHDIGKGHGHHHHERGAALAQEVAQRLGLDSEQTDTVVFLVRNHLMMSEIAQKRDIEDDHLVKEFARATGSIDRLKELYLMTFADMRAVAPKVYNNWRDMLLSDLYMKALKILEQGDREAVDPARLLALTKSELRSQLGVSADAERTRRLEEFLERMPDRYFLITPRQDIPYHFDLMRRLDGNSLVCQHRHFPDREFSEFIVATRDQHGLFSKIAGVLTASNLNILSARITTRYDGIVLDTFRISHMAQAAAIAMDEDRWERVERNLMAVLSGAQNIVELVARSRPASMAARRFVSRVPTEVTVDNRTSERFTVIDVFTQDRLGLLFNITYALSEMGLEIHLARISTNADQALDVFYVSDAQGRKIDDPKMLRSIETTLLEALGEQPAPQAQQANLSSLPD